MKRTGILYILLLVSVAALSTDCFALPFNGHADYSTTNYGLYYFISGGKFQNTNTPNGDNASGGVFRFLTDDPNSGYAIQTWTRDDWFPENAGIAVTLKNKGNIVYDNNGLENNTYGAYYNDAAAKSAGSANPTAGLYMGYEMPNNDDWIYAGYMYIAETTTVDEIIGYFDGNGYYGNFDPDSPDIEYEMNIWSNVIPDSGGNAGYNMPNNTGSFEGDIFSTENVSGVFSWSDTGAARVYSGWTNKDSDPIYRLTYELNVPITLTPGIYWFNHDAVLAPTPEPSTLILLGTGLIGLSLALRKKKSA